MATRTSTLWLAAAVLMVVGSAAIAQTTADLLAVRDAADKALNAHDVDTQVSYWTEDCVYDFVPLSAPLKGKAAARGFFDSLLVGIPDFTATARHVWAAGNLVVVECVASGTHRGTWMGIPATGKPVQLPHIDLYEFEGTKIKRGATYGDMGAVMIQLGVLPAPVIPPLVPSFTLPNAEPTRLAPVAANKEAFARWNSHDMVGYAKMLHPNFKVFAGSLGMELDRNGWVAATEMYFQIFTGGHADLIREVDLGDGWVMTETTAGGPQDGPFLGIPPTGRKVAVRQVVLHHFDADGLLDKMSFYWDNMTVVAQITTPPVAELLAIRDAADKAVNAHDLDAQMPYWADDCVYVFGPLSAPLQGKEAIRNFFQSLFAGIPDFATTPGRAWGAGNIVVVEHTASGTHRGSWMGIPPTGKPILMPHIDIYEFAGTKVKWAASYGDMASVMMQLGAMPQAPMPPLVPSFPIPDPVPTGLSPVAAAKEAQARWNKRDLAGDTRMQHAENDIFFAPLGIPINRGQYAAVQELYFQAFPDLQVYPTRFVDLGEGWVLCECTWAGTQSGPYFGIPATGTHTGVRGTILYQFDGQGLERAIHCYYDNLTILSQIAPAEPQPVSPGTKGLLAHYDFETDAKDVSGNGNHGTLVGDAHVAKGVLVLDGTDDAMSVPRIGGAGAVFGQASYSLWVHPTVDPAPLDFSGGMNTNVWGAGAVHFKLRNARINVGINGLAGGDLQGKTVVAPKTWSHMALTVSATEVSLYLNGQLEDSRKLTAPLTNLILGDAAIGAWNQNGTNIQREMTGFMDDVRIYNRALSVGEVLWLASYRQNDPEANKIVARRFFEEMWDQRRLDIVDELITADMAGHAPTGEFTGYKGEMQTISGNLAPFPDLQITVDEVIAEGNKVALRTSYRGTHLGTLMGQIPPTGKPIKMTGNIIFRFENGKVAEAWSFADMLGLMQQIGAASPARPKPEDYAWSAPSNTKGAPGDPETNKVMVRRFVDEVWNQQKLSVMDELFAPEVISHNPPIEYMYGRSNLKVLKQGVTDYLVAYPDLKVTLDDTVAEGAVVSARWTLKATHLGPLMGTAATGKPVTFTGVTMYRFAGGKIVELWWAWDTMGMMRQISPPKP